ncbi:hypothetical protein [Streptomyces sp. WM6386]|uniref:hypothetical protein n=1 Tax=Streptomyces sp. WM6386 TaxID=1415558 RepID=UPI000695CBD1|nr:hypothetical protein [Streptomyces sp. WM6386]
MQTSPAALPPTVWPARGRHVGSAAADVLRVNLQQLKDGAVVDDFLELKEEQVFEARWRVDGDVTVRARLTLGSGEEWVLVAEAEQPWKAAWASPIGMFWPLGPDAGWDHDTVAGLRLRDANRLPEDDKELRRLLRDCVRDSWALHIVVHEAMTPDERGRRPLTEHLPASLRHRVVEHRAAPHQLRAVNWALKEFDVQVPRGGAVVLSPLPLDHDTDADDFSVRSVFLDGTRPTELFDAVTRFAGLPRPLPEGAEDALTALREQWRLTTAEEELVRQRELVAMYAEALDAMTKSRDLYREAAERANEALAAYREAGAEAPKPSAEQPGSPLQQLTRTLERFKPRRPPRDENGVG